MTWNVPYAQVENGYGTKARGAARKTPGENRRLSRIRGSLVIWPGSGSGFDSKTCTIRLPTQRDSRPAFRRVGGHSHTGGINHFTAAAHERQAGALPSGNTSFLV